MVRIVILVRHAQSVAIGDSALCSASIIIDAEHYIMKKNVQNFLLKWIELLKSVSNDNALMSHVFPQSMPILWFGDFEEYGKSGFKIVTVGLNPSYKEFVERRFEETVIKDFNCKKCCAPDAYYESLNKYFANNPYTKWFVNFEKILQILGSTYGGKMNGGSQSKNCALHVDLMSPFATYPTWGNLCDGMQKRFQEATKGLFEELIILLKPNLIILSCGKKVVSSEFSVLKKINATGALSKFVYGFNWTPKARGCSIKVICGRNMRGTPFGGFTIGNGEGMKKLMEKLRNVK